MRNCKSDQTPDSSVRIAPDRSFRGPRFKSLWFIISPIYPIIALHASLCMCLHEYEIIFFFISKSLLKYMCVKLSSCTNSNNIASSAGSMQEQYTCAYLSICSWPRKICIYVAKAFFKATSYDKVGALLSKYTARGACLLYANILFCPEWSSGWMQTSTIFPCLNEVRDYLISGKYFNFISSR